jgi:hypothetical protein
MYGKASLVQIIKLFEPFETLFLTKLFISEEGKMLTLGVVSSMLLTVGAAMSLIRLQSTPPNPYAIAYAVMSGITLSSRNVLQRRQHAMNSKAVERQSALQEEPSTEAARELSKLERALVQFTQISLQSGLVLCVVFVPLHFFLWRHSQNYQFSLFDVLKRLLNWRILTWHPLYNVFSMITLSFCSALTHSLLNAGKRVFAIAMAILWFHESFSRSTGLGLAEVMTGGCWYTMESKASDKPGSQRWKWLKPVVSLFLLHILHILR